ncbi:hypothetical protein BDV38DRAFT_278997 [Aspergillus pseudotamarii]|uniref:HAD-like domain-containing protein n=1 Tax=Aspergillus pseudotamarii TaxID=132259 RepID=A0A5N6T5P4_ASPPS|nr:uncharacterized protein BDV38DRAFT_278997 [Aspergillus pseudotamarii]KAE8141644.1 hypothetical protein BDV38DRAFT_278997 [Aspergillus pseudotamarii]
MSQLNGHGFRVAMIGDGLNDFPALAMADEGTGLSLHGPQSTGAVVDMSILSGQLNRLIILFDITDRTVRHVRLIVGLIGLNRSPLLLTFPFCCTSPARAYFGMKSAIVSACILAFLSANLAGAAPPSGGQSVQGSPSAQGGLQPQAVKPLEPPVEGVGPPQKLEDYQQFTKKKKQYPGDILRDIHVSLRTEIPTQDQIIGMSYAGLPLGADTREMTATSLLPPKLTKPNLFPDVWLRRQYALELALNQEV